MQMYVQIALGGRSSRNHKQEYCIKIIHLKGEMNHSRDSVSGSYMLREGVYLLLLGKKLLSFFFFLQFLSSSERYFGSVQTRSDPRTQRETLACLLIRQQNLDSHVLFREMTARK